MFMTGLAGLCKGRMELMQSTVCNEGLPILPLMRLSVDGG